MNQQRSMIPSNMEGVFEGLTTAQKLAVVRSDSLPVGIGGLLLDVIEEDQVEVTSEVTDHYVETNTSIQDHITLAPEMVTLHGVVSELALIRKPTTSPSASWAQVSQAAQRDPLPTIYNISSAGQTDNLANMSMSPVFTAGALQAKADFSVPDYPPSGVLGKYESQCSVIGSTKGKKQEDVFNYLYQIWKGRQFVTVETAWGIWPNMVIQSLRSEQPKESRQQSEFWVTFKSIRFAEDIRVQYTPTAAERTEAQKSEVVPLGNGGQTEEPQGFWNSVISGLSYGV